MSNVQAVYEVLINEGKLSPVQAAGVIGRLQQESGGGLNPTIVGDRSLPGGSVGIAQWNRERKANLEAFGGANWADPRVQARFLLNEMGLGPAGGAGFGAESMAGRKLMQAKTLEDAAIAMMGYERPMGWTADNPTGGHGYANTVNNAQRLYEQYGRGAGLAYAGMADGPKGQEMYPRPGVPAPVPGQAPAVATAMAGGPFPPAPGQLPKGSWEKAAEALGKGVKGMGDIKPFNYNIAATPAAARVDAEMMPMAAVQDPREQLAMAMQRLNTGRLWG